LGVEAHVAAGAEVDIVIALDGRGHVAPGPPATLEMHCVRPLEARP
jgi:hypothetical protein